MSSPLARAYLEVIPSLEGAAKKIRSDLENIIGHPLEPKGSPVPKGWSQRVQDFGKSWQTIGTQISDVGDQMTKRITLPVVGATVAAAGLVATLGWKRLVSIDTAQGQLRGLGYTSEDVDRITQNLVGALEGGMLTMGQATSAAASGLAAGVTEGAELTRYIQLLDAATAGSNGTFEEMNQIFARIQGSGTLMTNELQMIEQRMPGFTSAVADSMGVTRSELESMVSAGQVSADDFLDVMEDFGGDMATEYAKTWAGMVQNTGAYIAILGEQLLGGVFEQSKESIAEFIDYLSSEDVQQWAADTGIIIGEAFGSMLEWIRSAIDWWMDLDGSTQRLILTFAGIAVALGPVLSIGGRLITWAGRIITAYGTLGGWLGRIAGAFGLTGAGATRFLGVLGKFAGPIGLAITAITMLWQQSETFREGLMGLWATVVEAGQAIGEEFMRLWTEAIQPILAQIAPAAMAAFGFFQDWVLPVIGAVFGFIFEIIKGVINNVVNMFSGMVDVITGVVSLVSAVFSGDWSAAWESLKQIVSGALKFVWNLIQAILSVSILGIIRNFARVLLTSIWRPLFNSLRSITTNILNSIRGFISGIVNTIRSLFSNAWNGVRANTQSIFNAIRSVITTVLNAVRAVVTTVLNAIRAIFSSVWNAARSIVTGAVNGIRAGVTGGFNAVRSIVTSVMSSVRSTISAGFNAARNLATTAVQGMRSSVTSGLQSMLSFIREIPGRIRNVFSNAGSLLVNSGRALIGGFTDGIRSAFGNAVDAVRNGVTRIRNLLPFSPAKEGPFSGRGYTLYSGQALMEDFGKGIASQSGGVVSEAESIVAEAARAFEAPDYLPDSWSSAARSPVAMTPSVSSASTPALVGAGAGGGGDIHVAELHVREEADIRKVAVELKRLQDRDRRG